MSQVTGLGVICVKKLVGRGDQVENGGQGKRRIEVGVHRLLESSQRLVGQRVHHQRVDLLSREAFPAT